MHTPMTRKEAAAQGRRTFYTGLPCKAGHISERYVSNGGCLGCLDQYKRTTINPWTKELAPLVLPPGYFAPAGLTPELHGELLEFIHQSVVHWVQHKGLMTPSIQNAYSEATRHRLQRTQVKP